MAELSQAVVFDAEALREHVQTQLQRIAAENELRYQSVLRVIDEKDSRYKDRADDNASRIAELHKLLDDGLAKTDPTELTNTAVTTAKEDIRREIAAMHELTYARVDGVVKLLDQLKIIQDAQPAERDQLRERLQGDIATAVENLAAITSEKFSAVQGQFDERDTRGEQEKKSSKEALDAALLAQKESVSQQNDANTTAATKSETSFTKQIDQIGTLIATLEKSLTDRITELKERIDRGEGVDTGRGATNEVGRFEQQLQQQLQIAKAAQFRQAVTAGIAGLSALIAIIAVLVLAFKH